MIKRGGRELSRVGSEDGVVVLRGNSVGFHCYVTGSLVLLISKTLSHKLLDHDYMVDDVIGEVDLGMCEPWDLPELSKVKSKDPQWYFFNKLRVKYRKSNKCSRATQAGYWKITCKDCSIKRSGTNNIIGIRKTLVFYIGRSATNWLIHEFHSLTFPDEKLEDSSDFLKWLPFLLFYLSKMQVILLIQVLPCFRSVYCLVYSYEVGLSYEA
ncbi:hypothetical protein RIF29_16583 [Crotalaria pallida]|uniref:NAC domain-containing protein n=1 Tax=Crotalaria pallida TaxID=3830 RepID=A0AAN9FHL8_CROPI